MELVPALSSEGMKKKYLVSSKPYRSVISQISANICCDHFMTDPIFGDEIFVHVAMTPPWWLSWNEIDSVLTLS